MEQNLKNDKKFTDGYKVIVLMIIFMTVLALVTKKIRDMSPTLINNQLSSKAMTIDEKLRPFGRINIKNSQAILQKNNKEKILPTPILNAELSGNEVYNQACIICHGDGIGGAPKITDKVNWSTRITQGLDVLQNRSINGYMGPYGYMPPKGARLDLTEKEVFNAVDYMLSQISQ